MKEKDFFDISSSHPKSNVLNGKYKNKWVEESFNFENGVDKQIATASTRRFLGFSFSYKRINLLLFFILLGIFVVFARVFYLQIFMGDHFRALAEGNRIRMHSITAERGIIYDINNKEIVQNVPSFSLAIVPQDMPRDRIERTKLISQISTMSGVSSDHIEELASKYRFYSYESLVIKEDLDYETALKLYIQNADLPGVIIEKGTKRSYINGIAEGESDLWSLSHIIGYLGKLNDQEVELMAGKGYRPSDYMGKSGLEKTYEAALRGINGKKKVEVNAVGKEINVVAEEPPTPGTNLVLTIDIEAQKELEKIVKKALITTKTKRAAAIAMNPKDGSILAMVSWPSFDNNDFSGGISQEKFDQYLKDKDRPLFSRAISGSYPSGSIVKMVIAAAALQEKIITASTQFLSNGGLDVGGHLFKDWKAGGHGYTNVGKALAWSVNTFFYYVGGGYKDFVGLGIDRIDKYMGMFNLGKQTEIDLPNENSGFVPSREWKESIPGEHWYVGDTYNLSIGQGNLLVTPLQAAVWTAVVANGGTVIQPHVVQKMVEPTKKEIVFTPKILNDNFISSENMIYVQGGMKKCVTEGSCKLMMTLPFSSAGKTGTAQWSTNKAEHAWFTSYAPATNPKIVVTVLVEEGGEGSITAMPIARDFLAWWGAKYLK